MPHHGAAGGRGKPRPFAAGPTITQATRRSPVAARVFREESPRRPTPAGVWTALSNGDGSFQPPRFVLADLGFESGWRVERHPRLLADLTNDGQVDIVGFGQAGVFVALSNGDGSFAFTPELF